METKSEKSKVSEDVFQDERELENFKKVVESFKSYHYCLTKSVANSLKNFHNLNQKHKEYLMDFEDNCKLLLECIDHNDDVIRLFIRDAELMFENSNALTNKLTEENSDQSNHSKNDVDRVCTTLKQIIRDWSIEGENERQMCYKPILDELINIYSEIKDLSQINVLVPGCGLGRLAFDIATKGFMCEGNEFSLHMLIASNFIINNCFMKNQYKIYPYVDSWSNNINFENQTREIHFPDVSPHDFSNQLSQFSMGAGDFLEVYNEEEKWECIVTCFFIDTAHNIIDYIERIWKLLKRDGYWINLGPLLYHFSKIPGEFSIELSYKQLKRVIERVGFKYLKEEFNVKSKYNSDDQSLLQYTYDSIFFVVQKN
ncbi:unnamed protein product [Brachionus calyciflorus]|uniref:carnosine N-methyltransferase n=1 Tax=Brachionus calyciflorus TaxID=104777 RepID=A0A813NJZ7_9BILA|nr:unnamed protein product [Brachionus calyciflorus]